MNVLIIDDDTVLLQTMAVAGQSFEGVTCSLTHDLADTNARISRGECDLLLVGRTVSGPDGARVLALIEHASAAGVTTIVFSDQPEVGDMRAAMRCGAFDYLSKREAGAGLMRGLLENVRRRIAVADADTQRLPRISEPQADSPLVGNSAPMRKLRELVTRVAESDRPVLVTGPTGAGKEVTVREIHLRSDNSEAPLVDLNCGALPAPLIESQLFGHERGAFTGADRKHEGFFATVGNGTLFLDEIGELPPDLQAKLLRVIETRTFRPLGSSEIRQFHGRIVAATHVDLAERVEQGKFREDLFYRLNVLEIHVPSLEERRDDIPALLSHFVALQRRPLEFSSEAVDVLVRSPWPGNIRQLRNVVDRLAVFAPEGTITAETVRSLLVPRTPRDRRAPVRKLVREILLSDADDKLKLMEGTLVEEAMEMAQGNKSAAARILGVHRKVVERRVG